MRTSELKGSALDWAVAKCEEPIGGYKAWVQADLDKGILHGMNYSTDWQWGGPIIERELIGLEFDGAENFKWWGYDPKADNYVHGETPLIAAMRCYVTSKLGEFVDIPEELL